MPSVQNPARTVRSLPLILLFLLAGPALGAEEALAAALAPTLRQQEQEAPPPDRAPEPQEAEDEGAPSLPEGMAAPLFADDALLEFTLEADFSELRNDRSDENPERPGVLTMTDPSGGELKLDLQIRTRGNFRLKRRTCSFPPLRLNFQKKQVIGSVFEYQDKLKLVGHCQDRGDRWEQQLLNEYAAYRILNQLTDRSFRVRLARITYIDTAKPDDDPLVRLAFLIERDGQMASRTNASIMDVDRMHPGRYYTPQVGLVALFQYMIGNTDFSTYEFHNVVPARADPPEGSVMPMFYPVPYDFDWSGLVDAPYAEPNELLNIRDVKERIYRGFCWPDMNYTELYAHFQDNREAIMAIWDGLPGVTEDTAKRARQYLEGFYNTIENEGRRRGNIEAQCRNW